MPDEQTVDAPESIETLQRERNEAIKNYEKLQRAHSTLKEDLKDLKATTSTTSELQAQLEALTREKETIQTNFDSFKTEVKKRELKAAVTTALTDAVKPSALSTALKLVSLDGIEIDENGTAKPDSLIAAVSALRESDPVLFKDSPDRGTQSTPAVKHAVDRLTTSAYEAEIAEAVKKGDAKLLEEIVAKYKK